MLSVGINASPLAAPRTGVGRYIVGLLGALERLAPRDVRCRPLFAPRAATARAEPPASASLSAFRAARRLAKRLPGAYGLAQSARALLLEAERLRGLSLYHETNHAAPRFRGPVVLTVHDLSTLLHAQTQEEARARHFSRALRAGAPRAVRVITPTAVIAREVAQHLGVPSERLRVIPHGVEPRFSPQGTKSPPPGVLGPYLLYVGALDPRKGLPALLDAYDALPKALARELTLVLAGPLGRPDWEFSRRLAASREGRVVATGFVDDAALPSLLRGAAAFCYPSSYEGFGLPLLEALSCGVPSVASDDPALVEVAGGAALHAPRGDAAALAATLQRLLEDGDLRERLRRQGPERAAGFRWEESARLHLQVYREAAA